MFTLGELKDAGPKARDTAGVGAGAEARRDLSGPTFVPHQLAEPAV